MDPYQKQNQTDGKSGGKDRAACRGEEMVLQPDRKGGRRAGWHGWSALAAWGLVCEEAEDR